MIKLNEKDEVNRSILKCDDIRHSPSKIGTINTANYQKYIAIHRQDSVISLSKSYLDINFDVIHAASNNRYSDKNDIKLVNLGPIALFTNHRLTTSSGKHLDDISHAHIVSLMYKLITSAKGSDDLSIGFDSDRNRRQHELTNNKNRKRKKPNQILFKRYFWFCWTPKKATYGLEYILTLTRNSDNSVLNKDNATNIGKNKIIAFEWYVPHYTPSTPQRAILPKSFLS